MTLDEAKLLIRVSRGAGANVLPEVLYEALRLLEESGINPDDV